MFRKYYKGCSIASICFLVACSSAEPTFGNLSLEEKKTSTTSVSVKAVTSTTAISPTHTPSTVLQTTPSTEELTPTSSLVIENEIAVETTFLTDQTDDKEKSEIEVIDLIEMIIRTPTKNEPLRVTSIGDSVSYDADPAIKAVLEATGVAIVENRSFGGVGLTQKEFQTYLADSLNAEPEVMTVMVGGWDLAFAQESQEEYEQIVKNSVEEILKISSLIIWIGMPPTPEAEGLEETRHLVNQIYKEISDHQKEVEFIDTDKLLGDEKGAFARFVTALDGETYQVRKVRDGKDDGHLCPFGAGLIGSSVFEKIVKYFPLVVEEEEWWLGEWTRDQRYDDPPQGCSYNPIK